MEKKLVNNPFNTFDHTVLFRANIIWVCANKFISREIYTSQALEFNPLWNILHPTSRLSWLKVIRPHCKNKGMSLYFGALADEGEVCVGAPSKVQSGKAMGDWGHWKTLWEQEQKTPVDCQRKFCNTLVSGICKNSSNWSTRSQNRSSVPFWKWEICNEHRWHLQLKRSKIAWKATSDGATQIIDISWDYFNLSKGLV